MTPDPSTLSREEIARCVAVEVMGWSVTRRVACGLITKGENGRERWVSGPDPDHPDAFDPTENIAHAWEVVEKMKERGFFADVRIGQRVVHCDFADYDGEITASSGGYAKVPSAPLAISLAALRAVRGG